MDTNEMNRAAQLLLQSIATARKYASEMARTDNEDIVDYARRLRSPEGCERHEYILDVGATRRLAEDIVLDIFYAPDEEKPRLRKMLLNILTSTDNDQSI